MNSIGRSSGLWNCKSRMTSFTSAITLRAAIVSSLQSMHLLMGTMRRDVEYNFLIMLSSPSLPNHQKNVFTLLSPLLNDSLLWVPHSFEWPTLLSTLLSNKLFWALFLVIYSWEQFFEPSFERWNSFEHFFEHSNECTYIQEPFFEWIYSRECSFGHFL